MSTNSNSPETAKLEDIVAQLTYERDLAREETKAETRRADGFAKRALKAEEEVFIAYRYISKIYYALATIMGTDTHGQGMLWSDRLKIARDALKNHKKIEINVFSQAEYDVLAERRRQIEVEQFSKEHDAGYSKKELAFAAYCYVGSACGIAFPETIPAFWPWSRKWWKPTTTRQDLVKAAALILAEINRMDNASKD